MSRFLVVLLILGISTLGHSQFWNDFELEPHSYRGRKLQDPVTQFLKRVDSGEVVINEADGKPLLERLLTEFGVPISSQVIVFTKTSLQRDQVSAATPRAMYFNEDVYIGWMPEGRIEIASIDPEVGPVFYFQRPLGRSDDLLFRRTRSCLGCHAGSATNFLPGLLGQSSFPRLNGSTAGVIRSFERVSHDVPYRNRWGGWMVTGQGQELLPHMGNAIISRQNGKSRLQRKTKGILDTDLSVFFPNQTHLAQGSDVVAMLAHDHQITAQYRMNEAQFRVRQAFFDASLPLDSGRQSLTKIKKTNIKDVSKSIDKLLKYFLFANEAPLGGHEISGHGSYLIDFQANKRVSKLGQSVKDLNLKDRFLEHRLSWMIYSNAFEHLPKAVREEFFYRLWAILTDPDGVDGYEYLPKVEKDTILKILIDTKKGLPEYFYW